MYLNWTDKKVRTKLSPYSPPYMVVTIILMFRTAAHCFTRACQVLSMVRVIEGKLYRNDLKGNKNYFELARGSSYRVFGLSSVRVTESKITGNPGKTEFWLELARGSS